MWWRSTARIACACTRCSWGLSGTPRHVAHRPHPRLTPMRPPLTVSSPNPACSIPTCFPLLLSIVMDHVYFSSLCAGTKAPSSVFAPSPRTHTRLHQRYPVLALNARQLLKVWNTNGVDGVHRFLARSWRLLAGGVTDAPPSREQQRLLHLTIKKVCRHNPPSPSPER